MSSKSVFAHIVLQKCNNESHFCAKRVVEDIKWIGHTKVVIKTNNERAIVSLKIRVARLLREFEGLQNVSRTSRLRAPRRTICNPMEESKLDSDW